MKKGGGKLSQKVTKDGKGGGLKTPKIGWHNMWTASCTAIITQIIHWTDQQRKRRKDLSWDAAAKIWVKKFQLNLRKANLAQSLNQGFVRFESSLHPYFTIFVGRLGNYFKLHPPFFKPAFQRRTFPTSFPLQYKTTVPHVSHMTWPNPEFWDGCQIHFG